MYSEKETSCRTCGHTATALPQTGILLTDVRVSYFECTHCGYVQTETPHWLERAYAVAINDSDTGIMLRNQANARIVLGTVLLLKKLNGRVVDCAGGYGILVRLLRDYGVEALWSDRYCDNLLARGFEYASESADLVTAFEVFEHFVNPMEELDKLLTVAPNILFSTEIISDPAPDLNDWWYYGKEHGQHIGFFRLRTLDKMAKSRGKFLLSDGRSYHLMTDLNIAPVVWKVLIRLNKFIPALVCHRLISKTPTDFLQNVASSRVKK
jgi:hypothetical protein